MSLLSKERDKTLIRRIINDSDRAAADELVSCYYKKVYRHIYARMKDAELSMDIVQETFIAALKGLGTFSGEKASFKTWIERIADNKISDYYKSRQHS